MTARDIIDQASIVSVWAAVGGGPLRYGRGKAFWRDGDGYSVSLNQDKNVFFDFVTSTGSILDLVRTVNGCDRRGRRSRNGSGSRSRTEAADKPHTQKRFPWRRSNSPGRKKGR